jgi:hypothetical protein
MTTHVYGAEPWAVAGCGFTNAAAPTYVRLPHGDLFAPGSIGPRKSPSGRLVVFAVTTVTASRRLSPAFEKCHVMASARPSCVSHACSLVLQFGTDVRPQGRGRGIAFRSVVPPSQTPQARLSVVHARADEQVLRAPARVSRARGQKLPHEVAKLEACRLQPSDTGTPRTGQDVCTLTGMSLQNVGQLCNARLGLVATSAFAPLRRGHCWSLGAVRASISCWTQGDMEMVAACR